MKHMELQNEPDGIRNFVLSLRNLSEEVVLDLHGNSVVQVVPLPSSAPPYDVARLEQAILARREVSREINSEWEPLDIEVWERN